MKHLALWLVLPFALLAQPEFFGYFESEADVMQLGSEQYNFGYHKFRLDIEARPNENVLIGVNINAQQFWGKTTWNLIDFIPQIYPEGTAYFYTIPDTILLDNIYTKLSFPYADLTLGKQQISPGVGYAWNPTDIFNSKSLMDPSYEQTGVKALRLDIPLGDRASAIAIIQPEPDLDYSTQQYILKTGFRSFDFSATGSYQGKPDWTSTILGRNDIMERSMLGGSVIGEFLGWGIWGEYSNNTLKTELPPYSSFAPPNSEETFTEYLVGVDHTFDNSVYVLIEHLHNGLGAKAKEDLWLSDYLLALGGETHSLNQDYGFFYIMHPTFDYVSLSALIIANFNDKSGTYAPQLDWNVFEDTNISLQGNFSWGAEDTEFGLQEWGLRLRLRSDF
mgnify:CR=1 FL=1